MHVLEEVGYILSSVTNYNPQILPRVENIRLERIVRETTSLLKDGKDSHGLKEELELYKLNLSRPTNMRSWRDIEPHWAIVKQSAFSM